MEEKDLRKVLDEYSKEIKGLVDAANSKRTEVSPEDWEKVKKETKDQVEPLTKKMEALQAQLDNIETAQKRANMTQKKAEGIDFNDAVRNAMHQLKADAKGDIKGYIHRNKPTFELKADDMTTGNTYTGAVVPPDRQPDIRFAPDTSFRVRDLISQGTTSSSSVTYVYESAISDGSLLAAEAQEYGQSDVDLAVGTGTVRKLTGYVMASEEMLDDTEGLSSYLNSRLSSKLKLLENYQLLYGNGAGINLTGLTTGATAYSDALADSNITRIDVLVDALRQVKIREYEPTFALIHPTDATKIKLAKNSTGDYIHPYIFMPQPMILDGIPVYSATSITAGQFLVGDGLRGAQVFDRKQMAIEISYQNEDNFIKGMVTVRISERLTLCIYNAYAFVYGSFTAALAQGSA